jgi:hypothetical protein
MTKIDIDDKPYNVATTLDDLSLGQWCELMKVVTRREWKEIGKMATSDEIMKEIVEVGKESEEFKDQKVIDILCILSDIPAELFTEFPSLVDVVSELVQWSDLMKDDSKVSDDVEIYDVKYKRVKLSEATFQQWCDFENFVSETLIIAFVVFLSDGTSYNRFHPDFDTKMMMFGRCDARGNVALLNAILDEVYKARDEYKYVYSSDEESEPAGRYISEHCRLFNWEDVIVSIAETNMFTSERGNLRCTQCCTV